eukprot:2587063-Rhodomonas_salina.2
MVSERGERGRKRDLLRLGEALDALDLDEALALVDAQHARGLHGLAQLLRVVGAAQHPLSSSAPHTAGRRAGGGRGGDLRMHWMEA